MLRSQSPERRRVAGIAASVAAMSAVVPALSQHHFGLAMGVLCLQLAGVVYAGTQFARLKRCERRERADAAQ